MWPWGHLAFGYLLYLLVRPRAWREADRPTVLAVLVGTQLPDLIDKPLAWGLGVLPSGRSLAHSLLFAAVAVALVAWVARRRGQPETGVGFGVGYASHLVGDSLVPLWEGSYGDLTFLAWPLLPLPPDYGEPSGVGLVDPGVVLAFVELSPLFAAELAAAAGVCALLGYHLLRRPTA